jgi:DNA replication initiation complex subunit (GINS family)
MATSQQTLKVPKYLKIRGESSIVVVTMADIKITLETLYDILRNEKKREDLQKLESTFFVDVVSYLREKKILLESKQGSDELFAAGERDKLEYELRSIKRILKEIYEKREKKIIDISLNKSRTRSDIIDTSSMLIEEKDFYRMITATFDSYRRGIIGRLFNGELPTMQPSEAKDFKKTESPKPIEQPLEEGNETETPVDGKTRIKFTHPMPSFVWKDMKVYGPFDAGEEIDIFPEVANLIVRKGRAEKV